MQSNQYANSLSYASVKNPRPIPGLKVAYGATAQQQIIPDSPDGLNLPSAGLLTRLKKSLFNLVTEEAPNELPIGISQLSRKTFQATETQSAIFKQKQTIQDYRFNQLIEASR